METLGTVVIRDASGTVYTVDNVRHPKFMDYKSTIQDGEGLFFVLADRHVFINNRHVVSVEWVMNVR